MVHKLGFDTPPGGKIGSDQHVLNDHTYCCQLAPDVCSANGEPSSDIAERCLAWHNKRINQRVKDAKKL